jgi:hypothetical protein
MPIECTAVSGRVLNHQYQTDWPRVHGDKFAALRQGKSVLRLEIECHPFDLQVQDLVGAEEDEICGAAVLADQQFKVRLPTSVGRGHDLSRKGELTGISEPRRSDIDSNGRRHSNQRVELDAHVAALDSSNGGPGNPGSPVQSAPGHGEREAPEPYLLANEVSLSGGSVPSQSSPTPA